MINLIYTFTEKDTKLPQSNLFFDAIYLHLHSKTATSIHNLQIKTYYVIKFLLKPIQCIL